MNLQGWYYNPQGSAADWLQGGSAGVPLQGSSPTLQTTGNPQQAGGQGLQVTANPMNYTDPYHTGNSVGVLGAETSVGGAGGAAGGFDAAAAAAAANAAKANALRGEITNLVNNVKDIFNARYGQVDQSAAEQSGKLNTRFGNESQDITNQVAGENAKIGAAHAASGSFDSSYRGNNVDTVTHAGEAQIRDLGQELQDNLAKIAGWVTQQKAGFDANKAGADVIMSRLGDTTDLGELTNLRSQLDQRITDLRAGAADNNTTAQNLSALESIAPSSARAQSLKTTLSQIIAGNADASQKSAIGQKLISSAGLSPQDAQQLLNGFTQDLAGTQDKKQPA